MKIENYAQLNFVIIWLTICIVVLGFSGIGMYRLFHSPYDVPAHVHHDIPEHEHHTIIESCK